MSVFADSSALVKLYADEPGATAVRAAELFTVSALARVAVPAALARKVRTGSSTGEQGRLLIADFEADWYGDGSRPPRVLPVVVAPDLLVAAARLAATHGLRAYDAVQLATALAARQAAPGGLRTFACFDAALSSAAATVGFAPLDP